MNERQGDHIIFLLHAILFILVFTSVFVVAIGWRAAWG